MRFAAIALLLGTALVAQTAPPPAAPPCISATAACTEWVLLKGGPGRSMIYRTFPLDQRNEAVRRALLMVHGTARNADHYFRTAVSAAFLADALADTVVIAPHMIDRTDPRQEQEVVWATSWRTGGPAADDPRLSSFDFADEILRKLADKATFPNLRAIVVAGHSAGGQFVNRYAMSNRVHDTLGVPITYVVANPSSYAWPSEVRPLPQDDADPVKAKEGWSLSPDTAVHRNFTFGPFDAAKAPNFNRWPMGLEHRTGYTESLSDEQLRKQLVERPTTYLLGQVDTLPLGDFDSSPNAMAQGPTRRSRGEAYFKYVTERMGAKHAIQIVSECGHNARCMFTTDAVLPVLFPREGESGRG